MVVGTAVRLVTAVVAAAGAESGAIVTARRDLLPDTNMRAAKNRCDDGESPQTAIAQDD